MYFKYSNRLDFPAPFEPMTAVTDLTLPGKKTGMYFHWPECPEFPNPDHRKPCIYQKI